MLIFCRDNQRPCPKRMLIHDDHLSVLQSALKYQFQIDGNIQFYCSDGKIEVTSTYLKVHSKLLSRIIPDVPYDESKVSSSSTKSSRVHTIILPDVPKSHISHLVNLVTLGRSRFSVIKLSAIETISDVIHEVLSTADLLNINLTNYGFDLEDDTTLVPKQEPEYYELSREHVKMEITEEVDSEPNGEEIPHIDDISVEKDSKVSKEILISSEDTPTQNCRIKLKSQVIEKRQQGKARKRNAQDDVEGDMSVTQHLGEGESSKSKDPKVMDKKRCSNNEKRRVKSQILPINNNGEQQPEPRKTKFTCNCFNCGETYDNLSSLSKHQLSQHWPRLIQGLGRVSRSAKKQVKCTLCSKMIVKNLMGAHILGYHRKKNLSVPCSQCGDMFSDLEVFYLHMSRHVEDIRINRMNNKRIHKFPATVTLESKTDGATSLSGPIFDPSPLGLPPPTVEQSGKITSTWLGSDLLSSTGQAASCSLFQSDFVQTGYSNSQEQEQIRVASAVQKKYSIVPQVSSCGTSNLPPGGTASKVPKSDDFSPYPFGRPKNLTCLDNPVFGKSLSLLKSKSNEPSKSQTNKDPSGDKSSSFRFNFYNRGPT